MTRRLRASAARRRSGGGAESKSERIEFTTRMMGETRVSSGSSMTIRSSASAGCRRRPSAVPPRSSSPGPRLAATPSRSACKSRAKSTSLTSAGRRALRATPYPASRFRGRRSTISGRVRRNSVRIFSRRPASGRCAVASSIKRASRIPAWSTCSPSVSTRSPKTRATCCRKARGAGGKLFVDVPHPADQLTAENHFLIRLPLLARGGFRLVFRFQCDRVVAQQLFLD